jgi:hypothetical protein
MSMYDFMIDVVLLGLWFWVGVVLGLLGAWVVWNYWPELEGRASVGAMVFLAGCALGVLFEWMGEGKKK